MIQRDKKGCRWMRIHLFTDSGDGFQQCEAAAADTAEQHLVFRESRSCVRTV